MKNILIVICTCIVGGHLIAQNNVGIGILSPNPKALLDLTSNNKGFLAPRMTSAERIAIAPSSTEQGLLVFDTDTKFYYFWDGVQWIQLPGNNAFNISLTFDSITQTLTITDNR
jgi:hypothetical protein